MGFRDSMGWDSHSQDSKSKDKLDSLQGSNLI